MRKAHYILPLTILLLLINLILWGGRLRDGNLVDSMMRSAMYIGTFSYLLFFAVRSHGSGRKAYLIMLMLVHPCLFVHEIGMSEDYQSSGYKLEMCGCLGSICDMLYNCVKSIGGRSSMGSDYLFPVVQIYCLIQTAVFTVLLLRFKGASNWLYAKAERWIPIGLGLAAGAMVMAIVPAESGIFDYFSGAYLPFYCLLLVIFVMIKRGTPAKISWRRPLPPLHIAPKRCAKYPTHLNQKPPADSYRFLVTSSKFDFMGRNTSVSLGEYFEGFVENRISEGRFNNASEVIRAGLRLLEEEENKVLALRSAIQEGINSGFANDFNPKHHLEKIKARKRRDG